MTQKTANPRTALVLDGGSGADHRTAAATQALRDALDRAGIGHETIVARDLTIGFCTGCFGCWIKTPGSCALGGPSLEFARQFVAADLLVISTPVTFGGYSSDAKKVFDRTACSLLLPFFTQYEGDTHHPTRYDALPELLALGTLPAADPDAERVFQNLVYRNSLNLHNTRSASVVVAGDPDSATLAATADALLAQGGVATTAAPPTTTTNPLTTNMGVTR